MSQPAAMATAQQDHVIEMGDVQQQNEQHQANTFSGGREARQQQQQKPVDFDKQAHSSKRNGLLVAGLQLVSRFFGFCALTWATVVLLGGFASALRPLDFYLISVLLLAEGMRLFIVQTFSKLLSRALFLELHRPQDFTFTDRQAPKAVRLDLLGHFLGLFLAAASLASTCTRLVLASHGHDPLAEKTPPADGHSNVPPSLLIFYIISLCNSSFAILSSVLRPILRLRCHGNSGIRLAAACSFRSTPNPLAEDSLMCFQDEVYKTAMEVGLPEADQLNIFDFAFTKLASDYKRNIRPPLIKELNKDLIRHLYKKQHGIAMACEYMKGAGDMWKQIAAANLPGLWVEEERIESQMALFWALRERMYGAGKDAESALNSVEALGRSWADRRRPTGLAEDKEYPFLVRDSATDAPTVVEALVELLLEPIRPTLLFQVRAFEACCRHQKVRHHLYRQGGQQGDIADRCAALQALILPRMTARRPLPIDDNLSRLEKLCCKLQSVVAGAAGPTWQATNIYAGSALVALLCDGGEQDLGKRIKDVLATAVRDRINPAETASAISNYPSNGRRPSLSYFWVPDLEVVESLRSRLGVECYNRWKDVRIIQIDGTPLSDPPNLLYEEDIITNIIERARES